MKKIYLIIFISSLFQLHSQSWCTPGSTWYYAIPQPGDGYAKYTYLYDTLIGVNTCNKIKTESHGHGVGGSVINSYNYIYTYEQNGIVFKNNGTLAVPQYDTLYNFNGAVGTKWRCQLNSFAGGPSCSHSSVEITGIGTSVIQGQTLNWREIFYTNYYFFGQAQQYIVSGTDTIFERIGFRHHMEFISGLYCADITDISPMPFRCFSDYQINMQMSAVTCDYTTNTINLNNSNEQLEINNPATNFISAKITTHKLVKRIVLMDQLGNKVLDVVQSEKEFKANVEHLSNGIYIFQVYFDNDVVNRKLIIQN